MNGMDGMGKRGTLTLSSCFGTLAHVFAGCAEMFSCSWTRVLPTYTNPAAREWTKEEARMPLSSFILAITI